MQNNLKTKDDCVNKENESKPSQKQKSTKKSKNNNKIIIGIVFILCVIFVFGAYYYYSITHYVSTDDAAVAGHPIYICPKISGYASKIYVEDNQHVKPGQLLVEIDDRDYQLQLQEAKAQYEVAKAKLNSAKSLYEIAIDAQNTAAVDMHRNQILMAGTMMGKAVTQEKFEHTISLYEAAVSEVKAAKANIELAQANLDNATVEVAQAKLNLSYTKIYATQDGYITKKTIERGSFVKEGSPLFVLVSDNKWVIANFKETQLTNMRIGQSVNISIDAYPGKIFKGKIQSIQAGTGSVFSLLPPENATGNYVKVVQRVPVKITFDNLPKQSEYFLALGMSVEPTVKLK